MNQPRGKCKITIGELTLTAETVAVRAEPPSFLAAVEQAQAAGADIMAISWGDPESQWGRATPTQPGGQPPCP